MSAPSKRKVVLVGWDAADWQHIHPLLNEGLLPNLEALIERGVMGNLATLHPVLSPMLWNSIATGKLADKHGVHGFIEPDPVNGGARPYSSHSRQTKAIWNILSQAGLRSHVVGWWASHPAEPIRGTVVTNAFSGVKFVPGQGWTIPPGTVHPPERTRHLAPLRVFPHELTEAHILPFIPRAAEIDQRLDRRLQNFAKTLSDAATNHALVTALMELEEWDFTAVYYDAIDHFAHAFMPFHPPRLPWIDEREFELYREVMRGAYRFHDLMLGRIVELAGPDATIVLCSDHGFESGPQRPQFTPREPAGPAVWHRHYGILVMAGPGLRRDERIFSAGLLDLAPTLLTLFGLPVGADMDGRVLVEAFETPPEVQTIPSWDEVEGAQWQHRGGESMDRAQADELMAQFAALGYIENPHADREKQAESAAIENKYNLARVFLWKAEPARALPLLLEIVRARPWEDRFLLQLATACLALGRAQDAERLLAAAYPIHPKTHAPVKLLWARAKLRQGDLEAGLQALQEALAMAPGNARLHVELGDVFLRLRQLPEAEQAFGTALALDPDFALAHQGLAEVHRRRGRNQETVEAALRAVSLLHRLPRAHLNLGIALARAREHERAIVAFETALKFDPRLVTAHRFLALLHRHAGRLERALDHRDAAQRLQEQRRQAAGSARAAAAVAPPVEPLDLPEIPSMEERLAILVRERPDQKPAPTACSGKTFVLVSGLPRSGTSLMMQALAAGGLPPMTDGERGADVDNPRGYYEWEAIKQIAQRPEILDAPEVEGRAIKCVSMLLKDLPLEHDYRIIFMTRPLEEVVESQHAMVQRLGTQGAELAAEELAQGLRQHRDETLYWLKDAPHVQLLRVDYPALVRTPAAELARVAEFLGPERLPHPERMAATVDPQLHRQRSGQAGAA